MIRIECDNCERAIEVAEGQAGGKIACPYCGDVNRVPEAPAAAASDQAADRLPDDLPPDSGPEREICMVHPAMARAHPFRYALLVILAVGGAALMIAGSVVDGGGWMGWIGLPAMLVALVWWVVWFLAAHLWVKLTISNKRTIRHEGIVRRHTSEVLHDHVRNVEIQQSFMQRLCNVGYIGISSSGQDDIEIEVKDLPRPYELKALIDRYRNM